MNHQTTTAKYHAEFDRFSVTFYRAKLRVARYCHGKLSVRLSVRPSVCDVEVS